MVEVERVALCPVWKLTPPLLRDFPVWNMFVVSRWISLPNFLSENEKPEWIQVLFNQDTAFRCIRQEHTTLKLMTVVMCRVMDGVRDDDDYCGLWRSLKNQGTILNVFEAALSAVCDLPHTLPIWFSVTS